MASPIHHNENGTSRRDFLKTTIVSASAVAFGFTMKKKKAPRLSFSTLGCPKWTLEQVIQTASVNGYQGVEFRGLEGELFLPKRPEFSSAVSDTVTKFAAKDIKICGLGSSAALHHADAATRAKNLDEGKQFIDLAHKLSCPYVRIFPNNLPKDQDKQQTLNLITEGLLELARHAKESNVTVLLETHGDLVYKDDLVQVMKNAEHPNVGLIWDIFNMWSVTGETPATVFPALKKYIRHTHIKDAIKNGDKFDYVFIGKGIVPLTEAIGALNSSGYQGFYSFEWEKMWHPEIAEPELAFPDYPKSMKKYFS
ncbi:sugar phosphate isomerase/epimerase family protein [Chryseolinea sp. T2]|uniref:sugar phosphate isomerase/epimerase family protein n=1 Tax=Chryseolinea sp. T2 TaxID=3129255 RepID=UPI003076ECE0